MNALEINSVSSLLVWLSFTALCVCLRVYTPSVSEQCVVFHLQAQLRVRCGLEAANPAAIFEEDNVPVVKKVL